MTKKKELNRHDLLEKKYVTEEEFEVTITYEFWCFRFFPPFLRDKNERRILYLYLEFLKSGKLIVIDEN